MGTIEALGTSIPDFVATNEHVVSLVMERSEGVYFGDLTVLESDLRSFSQMAGSRERKWRSGFSTPLDHISEAWENGLEQFGRERITDIGSLIYCGIDRGVAEPSHASLLARRFGLFDVRCLDVSDACMGWYTAAQVARQFATSARPYSAIVSAEFPLEMPGKVYPSAFTMKTSDDLQWKGAALTLGEAASVTFVDTRLANRHVFRANSRHADACFVPLIRPERFVDSEQLQSRLAEDCFIADMPTMAAATYRDACDVLQDYIKENGVPNIVIPHTVSQFGPARASKHLLDDGTIKIVLNTLETWRLVLYQ